MKEATPKRAAFIRRTLAEAFSQPETPDGKALAAVLLALDGGNPVTGQNLIHIIEDTGLSGYRAGIFFSGLVKSGAIKRCHTSQGRSHIYQLTSHRPEELWPWIR